jgi:hypothetical protein
VLSLGYGWEPADEDDLCFGPGEDEGLACPGGGDGGDWDGCSAVSGAFLRFFYQNRSPHLHQRAPRSGRREVVRSTPLRALEPVSAARGAGWWVCRPWPRHWFGCIALVDCTPQKTPLPPLESACFGDSPALPRQARK